MEEPPAIARATITIQDLRRQTLFFLRVMSVYPGSKKVGAVRSEKPEYHRPSLTRCARKPADLGPADRPKGLLDSEEYGLLDSEECVRTLRTLKPGQKGTKELLALHGASLLCVRYRYGEDTRVYLKTVELVGQPRGAPLDHEEEAPTKTRRRQPWTAATRPAGRRRSGSEGGSAIGWRERDLRWRVKSAGGWLDPVRRVWILKHDAAERPDLLHRVVGGGGQIW